MVKRCCWVCPWIAIKTDSETGTPGAGASPERPTVGTRSDSRNHFCSNSIFLEKKPGAQGVSCQIWQPPPPHLKVLGHKGRLRGIATRTTLPGPTSPERRHTSRNKSTTEPFVRSSKCICVPLPHPSLVIWTHWDLNPGPSACEADVMPLHHAPK